MRTKADYINELFAPTLAMATKVQARMDSEILRVSDLVARMEAADARQAAQVEARGAHS